MITPIVSNQFLVYFASFSGPSCDQGPAKVDPSVFEDKVNEEKWRRMEVDFIGEDSVVSGGWGRFHP